VVAKVEVVEEAHHSDYYVVHKGLSIGGEKVGHHEADKGLGLGIDLGYRLGGGFATELGVSYAKNKLENRAEDDASYKTASLSLVYDLELTDSLALFAKGGYMYEKERVSALNIDSSEKGAVYGGGLSYKINDGMNLIAEYETSKIDSLRGDAIGVGLMFNF
jgi:opacity protein-like surface antigen